MKTPKYASKQALALWELSSARLYREHLLEKEEEKQRCN